MNVLAIGDVFADAGRRAVLDWLSPLRDEVAAGFVVVNVENLHNGRGADVSGVREILAAGADCLTSGNHIWIGKEHEKLLDREGRLLRPANYPAPCPGRGVMIGPSREGVRVAVMNLIGRLFMPAVDDPFQAADDILAEIRGQADIVVVDFHAEATSEKLALATHLAGRASAVFGTHTHVQTADARVLPGGTGFISDLGMTGPYDSVIGLAADAIVRRFRSSRPVTAPPAQGGMGLRGAVFDIDEANGRCRSVRRVARGAGGE